MKNKDKDENPSRYGKLGMAEILEIQNQENWYCGNCSTAKKGNTIVASKTKDRILTCEDCGIVIRFYIISPATKTMAEAAKSFEATPLTDSQTGHKPYRKRSIRKRGRGRGKRKEK